MMQWRSMSRQSSTALICLAILMSAISVIGYMHYQRTQDQKIAELQQSIAISERGATAARQLLIRYYPSSHQDFEKMLGRYIDALRQTSELKAELAEIQGRESYLERFTPEDEQREREEIRNLCAR